MFIKPKKSLGQNFLIDRNVLEQIVDTVEVTNKEVLEIGPGSGNLTTFILKKNPKKVYVIEKDDELSLLLTSTVSTICSRTRRSIKKFCPKLFLGLINIYLSKNFKASIKLLGFDVFLPAIEALGP